MRDIAYVARARLPTDTSGSTHPNLHLTLTFNQEMDFFEPPLPPKNKIKYERNIKASITAGQARITDNSRQTYLPNALTNLDTLMMHIYGPGM